MKNWKRQKKDNFRRVLSLVLAVVMVVTSWNWSLVVRAEETEAGTQYGQADEAAESASYGEEAVPVGEILSLREESSKQFLMSDGTISLVQYETDVHYQDSQGEWQEIDNSLSEEEDSSGYSTKAGKVKFKFSKNPNANFLVRIMQGEYHIFFSAVDSQKQSEGAAVSIHLRYCGKHPQRDNNGKRNRHNKDLHLRGFHMERPADGGKRSQHYL